MWVNDSFYFCGVKSLEVGGIIMFWFIIGIVIALLGGFIILSAQRHVMNVIGGIIQTILSLF